MQNQNKVELVGYYGSDKTHCLSAWTSTFVELGIELPKGIGERIDTFFNYMKKTKKKSPAELLDMLASEGHHTPFEKSSLHFVVNTDIATHIHLLKHRIGVSINAESARYKELKEDKVFIPEDWKEIPVNDTWTREELGADWYTVLESYNKIGNAMYHLAIKELTPVLGRKRTKESARFFKTYSSQITSDIMFNWRSFMHFQKLRNSKHAQKEVRELAQQMMDQVKQIPGNPFDQTIKAFEFDY